MPKITAFLPEYFLNKRRRGHARAAALILRYPPPLCPSLRSEIHSTPFRCAQNDKERQTARPQPGKNFIKAPREK